MLLAAAAVPATQLDRDNPWPGLESFEENARDFFHGREAETEELLRRVADAPVTVLFGKSGLGKTSLLKAGLFPRLREKRFLPVHVRLGIRPEAPGLIEQLRDGLRAEIEHERVDAPPFAAGETLWEYLHRADLELWSAQNYPLTPVLVLDHFEEVFTLGERLLERVERFRMDLGDLAENRIPAALASRLAADASAAQRLDLRRMSYKLIVALREDFLPHLEGWRAVVPSLGRVRVRLLPMRPKQALSAVYGTAPHLLDEPLARRIVAFVAAVQAAAAAPSDGAAQEPATGSGAGGEIEPALLSLFCRGLNERRKRQGKDRFDEQLLEGAGESIIGDHYRACVADLPDSVSRFIESDLITEKGFRNSYAKDDAVPGLLTEEQLEQLINRRLLRLEERYGTARIELTHDLLTRPVMEHRDRRRVEEEKAALARRAEEERRRLKAQAQRWRVLALALFALVCLTFAGIAVFVSGLLRERFLSSLHSYSRDSFGQFELKSPAEAVQLLDRSESAQQRWPTDSEIQTDIALAAYSVFNSSPEYRDRSLKLFKKALMTLKELPNLTQIEQMTYYQLQAHYLLAEGERLRKADDARSARAKYLAALDSYEDLRRLTFRDLHAVEFNLCNTARMVGRLDYALERCDAADRYARENRLNFWQAKAIAGRIYENRGNLERAASAFHESWEIAARASETEESRLKEFLAWDVKAYPELCMEPSFKEDLADLCPPGENTPGAG